MTKIRMTKLTGGKALRTNTVDGECESLPEEGSSFIMFAKPLEGGSLRLVQTSPVVTVEQERDSRYVITTESGSKYQIDLLLSIQN
jgi:hypothetical protein